MPVQLTLDGAEDVRVLLRAVRNQLRSSRRFNRPEHVDARERLEAIERRLTELLPYRGFHSV